MADMAGVMGWLQQQRGVLRPALGAVLTNTIAFWIGLILLAGIIADFAFDGGLVLEFLAKKFLDLVEWVDFWD